MKNILTTILVLFALVVNAQSDSTMAITNWLSTGESDTTWIKIKYDTTVIYGLGMYINNYSNQWNVGTELKLEPVKKLKIQKFEVLSNGFSWAYASPVYEVYLKKEIGRGKCLDCPIVYDWIQLSRNYTEVFFIKEP